MIYGNDKAGKIVIDERNLHIFEGKFVVVAAAVVSDLLPNLISHCSSMEVWVLVLVMEQIVLQILHLA
jgi:hypothetical protein